MCHYRSLTLWLIEIVVEISRYFDSFGLT
jgi:hypothetical protein